MSQHTTLQAKSGVNEVTLSRHSTDSPVLPVAQIERLHEFRPDRVDWVFDQTQLEAEARRRETAKVNNFIFVERIAGQIFALIIALVGLGSATYMSVHGAETAGAIVGGATLVGMVTAFIAGRSNGKTSGGPPESPSSKAKPKK